MTVVKKILSKQIPGAKEGYKMDSDGVVYNPKGDEVSIHAGTDGKWGKIRIYTAEGSQKTFDTEEIFKELFPKSGAAKFADDRQNRGRNMTVPRGYTPTDKSAKPKASNDAEEEKVALTDTDKKIKKLDAPYSVKVYLLHKQGYNAKQIMQILERPDNPSSTKSAIENYGKNKSLRDKAEALLK